MNTLVELTNTDTNKVEIRQDCKRSLSFGATICIFFIRLGFHTFSPLAFFMLQKNVSGKIEIHLIIKNTGQPALKVLYFLFSIPKRGLFNMEKELDPLHSEKVIL